MAIQFSYKFYTGPTNKVDKIHLFCHWFARVSKSSQKLMMIRKKNKSNADGERERVAHKRANQWDVDVMNYV